MSVNPPCDPIRVELRAVSGWRDTDDIVLSFNLAGGVLRLAISQDEAAGLLTGGLRWFVDNWPEGAEWPAGVERPAAKCDGEAV
jgi:hypothetical protein